MFMARIEYEPSLLGATRYGVLNAALNTCLRQVIS